MRPIKFRAWDKRDGVMWLPDKHRVGYITKTTGNSTISKPFSDVLGDERYELLQFTGLLDKNGVEIYEFDYLNVWLDGLGNETFEVQWDTHKARFILIDKLGDTWSFDDSNDMEVIGNVWESRHLLEEDGQ